MLTRLVGSPEKRCDNDDFPSAEAISPLSIHCGVNGNCEIEVWLTGGGSKDFSTSDSGGDLHYVLCGDCGSTCTANEESGFVLFQTTMRRTTRQFSLIQRLESSSCGEESSSVRETLITKMIGDDDQIAPFCQSIGPFSFDAEAGRTVLMKTARGPPLLRFLLLWTVASASLSSLYLWQFVAAVEYKTIHSIPPLRRPDRQTKDKAASRWSLYIPEYPFRGGGQDNDKESGSTVSVDPRSNEDPSLASNEYNEQDTDKKKSNNKREESYLHRHPTQRRALDVLLDVTVSSSAGLDPGGDDSVSSLPLRHLFMDRQREFLQEQENADVEADTKQQNRALKRLLHVLAARIPAITHSPDIALRIVSAKATVDSGLAASLIATLAHVGQSLCLLPSSHVDDSHDDRSRHGKTVIHNPNRTNLVVDLLVKDRRFEQLMECLVCGVDIPKRIKEEERYQRALQRKNDPTSKEESEGADWLPELMDTTEEIGASASGTNEDATVDENMNDPLFRNQ